jgi:hypothetical protein
MLALLPDPPSRAAWRALGTGPCSVFGGVGLSSETVRVSTSEMVVVFFHQVRTGARTPTHCRPVSTQCVVTRVIDGLTPPPHLCVPETDPARLSPGVQDPAAVLKAVSEPAGGPGCQGHPRYALPESVVPLVPSPPSPMDCTEEQ